MTQPGASSAFETFLKEVPEISGPWMAAVGQCAKANALDAKTRELAYLAVLAALRMEGGVPFHVKAAKAAGATRAEVVGAVLVGLPAAGLAVAGALPDAIEAYDGP
jgi:AhpD family alkylhydroperoxidase